MFTSENVGMTLARASLKIVKDDKDVEHRMAECSLVIDPFGRALAAELGEDIAARLFTEDEAIWPDLSTLTCDPRVPQQAIAVRSAPDVPSVLVTVRQVEILSLTVAREEDKDSGQPWLKATVKVRFDLADKSHREFLAAKFGDLVWLTFEAEQHPLPLGGE